MSGERPATDRAVMGGGDGHTANTIPRSGSKGKPTTPRRKSFSLEKSPLERLRTTERRGSFAASSSLSPGGAPPERPERRGSIVHRWFRHISEAAEAYKTRDGKNRGRPEIPATSQPLTAPTTDIDTSDAVQEKTKETEESSNETKAPAVGGDTIASRGVSDHESNVASNTTLDSSGTPEPATEPASPLNDSLEAVTKKLGGGGQLSPPTQQRRAEPLRLLTEESPLIQPTEVVVSQRSVLTAEPVLTPIEKLRRKDEAIRLALSEKQQLVADILHVPREEFATIAELAGEPNVDKDATELVLAAVNQANQLSSVLNDTLLVSVEAAMSATSEVVSSGSPRAGHKVSRLPGVPTYKLQSISDALNMQLTELLKIIKHRDEEREQLRRELQKHREQIHALHENRGKNHLVAAPAAGSPSRSRPNSCVSVGSSHPDSEDDTGLQRLTQRADDAELLVAPSSHKGIEPPKDLPSDEFVDALTDSELETQIDERAVLPDGALDGDRSLKAADAVDDLPATCDGDASISSIPLPNEEIANVSGV